jgi:cell division protein FtsW
MIIPFIIVGTVCLLVALEKHFSGTIIIFAIGMVIIFAAGARLSWFIAAGIGAITVIGVAISTVPYAVERINMLRFPENYDPTGKIWQTLQGLYAVGSGGLFGVGLGNSRQKYGYVSQPQNDFVFTIICEELGFFGAALVVVMFSLLVIRGFKIAARCPDKYTSLLVFGLTFKVALQTILNIAVVTNSMPNTGISLPFFSSGGTSLALQIFEMGIILNISRFSTVKKG